MDNKAAGATTWVLDDTEMKELRGSLHSLETIAVLLGGFDSGATLEGYMLGDIAELIDGELRRFRGGDRQRSAESQAGYRIDNAKGRSGKGTERPVT